jgi:hypothetical protein
MRAYSFCAAPSAFSAAQDSLRALKLWPPSSFRAPLPPTPPKEAWKHHALLHTGATALFFLDCSSLVTSRCHTLGAAPPRPYSRHSPRAE